MTCPAPLHHSLEAVAQMLGCSQRDVLALVRADELPIAMVIGRVIYFAHADVQAVLRSRIVCPAASAAAYLRCGVGTIYALVNDGELDAFESGGQVLLRYDEVQAYMAAHEADYRLSGTYVPAD